jgi:lysozyme
MRQINNSGLELIKRFEGIEDGDPTTVNLDPYVCPANVWTIGWGHSITYNGRHLTISNDPVGDLARMLYPGGINMEQAEALLFSDTTRFALQVDKTVKVSLTDNQFSALVSFVFNVGIGNFMASTLLKRLNNGDYLGAADELPKWRRANGKILNGLVLRRSAERELFLKN